MYVRQRQTGMSHQGSRSVSEKSPQGTGPTPFYGTSNWFLHTSCYRRLGNHVLFGLTSVWVSYKSKNTRFRVTLPDRYSLMLHVLAPGHTTRWPDPTQLLSHEPEGFRSRRYRSHPAAGYTYGLKERRCIPVVQAAHIFHSQCAFPPERHC